MKYIILISLIIVNSSFANASSWPSVPNNNLNNNFTQPTNQYGYPSKQTPVGKKDITPKISNFMIFNSNTVVLLLVLIMMSYVIWLMWGRREFKLRKDATVEDMEKYLANIDGKINVIFNDLNKIDKERSKETKEYVTTLNTLVSDVKTTLSAELRETEGIISTSTKNLKQSSEKLASIEEDRGIELKTILEKLTGSALEDVKKIRHHIENATDKHIETIKRYEEGYNRKITKDFHFEIFKMLDYIKQELLKNNDESFKEILQEIEEDILILLENNDIKKLVVEVGLDFSSDLRNNVKTTYIDTDDKSQHNKIKAVKKDGYFIINPDHNSSVKRSVRDAMLEVYLCKQEIKNDK